MPFAGLIAHIDKHMETTADLMANTTDDMVWSEPTLVDAYAPNNAPLVAHLRALAAARHAAADDAAVDDDATADPTAPPTATGDFRLVLSDAAPDTTGIKALDATRAAQLVCSIVALAGELLPATRGSLVAKFRQGADAEADIRAALAAHNFRRVALYKPPSSRSQSAEIFVVASREA